MKADVYRELCDSFESNLFASSEQLPQEEIPTAYPSAVAVIGSSTNTEILVMERNAQDFIVDKQRGNTEILEEHEMDSTGQLDSNSSFTESERELNNDADLSS